MNERQDPENGTLPKLICGRVIIHRLRNNSSKFYLAGRMHGISLSEQKKAALREKNSCRAVVEIGDDFWLFDMCGEMVHGMKLGKAEKDGIRSYYASLV